MAQAHYVKAARKAIYNRGKYINYVSKVGKRKGETLTRLDRTVPYDDKDTVLIPKGSPYYYWQFKGSEIQYSLTRPPRSRLTRSEFLSTAYDLEDEIADYTVTDIQEFSASDLEAQRDEWVSSIEELRDGCQERLDNMPDGLRESSDAGMLLQTRVDAMESWSSELDQVDIDWDDDDLKQQALDEWNQTYEGNEQNKLSDGLVLSREEWLENRFLELKQEKIEEIITELQGCTSGVE